MKRLTSILFMMSAFAAYGKNFPEPASDDSQVSTSATISGKGTPLCFIENKGQVTDQNHNPRTDIQFSIAAAPGLNIFIGNGAIHYQFSKCNNPTAVETQDFASPLHGGQSQQFHREQLPKEQQSQSLIPNSQFQSFNMYRMDVTLIGANPNAQVITEEKQGYYENYFTQNTGPRGATAYTYNKVTYKNIYPDIDWVLYINNGQLEHEFVVNEGGNVADIQLKYGGATGLKLNTDGSLTAATPQGAITEQAPTSFDQNGRVVKSSFKLNGEVLAYEAGSYSGTLIIDPSLKWATYYGGGGYDNAQGITTDASGNVYITGYTNSTYYIASLDAYQNTFSGTYDAMLSKFSSNGYLLWATYYGGGGNDEGEAVTIDASGIVYITGYTSSISGIATPGAYRDTFSGGAYDAFLAQFSSAGAIQWATYFGGPGSDQGQAVATDGSGNVCITGKTQSLTGIATPGAYQDSFGGGGGDAFLAQFSSAGTLQWATYYGGNGDELGQGMAMDGFGNIYITSYTSSTVGIATPGAYQGGFGGGTYDALLAKFSNGGTLQWATYFGGGGNDYGYGVVTDGFGNPYITGYTNSPAGIATPGAYQTMPGGGDDAYLAEFNDAGVIQWATYFGGSGDEIGNGAAIDGSGNVYITGYTSSTSGVATPGTYQPVLGGGADALLAAFNNMGAIQWATYYGGAGWDEAWGIATSGSHAYIAGYTNSTTGMATPGAYRGASSGGQDVFIANFNTCDKCPVGVANVPPVAKDITVFPNPANNELTISAGEKITDVSINNLLGQTVHSQTCNTELVQVDVSALPAGVYFVKINGVEVRRFVKE